MKKSTLKKNLGLLNIQDYDLDVCQNGFKLDFSSAGYPHSPHASVDKSYGKKKSILSILMLIMLFFFTNFLFAQAPACNLSGPLKAKVTGKGTPFEMVTISSEVMNDKIGTQYVWSFKTNTSNAVFKSKNGSPTISLDPGSRGGNFTVELKVINPLELGEEPGRNICTCTQSVSVNK